MQESSVNFLKTSDDLRTNVRLQVITMTLNKIHDCFSKET